MNTFKKLSVFATCLSLVFFGWIFVNKTTAQNTTLPAPSFIEVVSIPKVYITGTTIAGSDVMIYLDDKFSGLATVNNTVDTSVRSFYYAFTETITPGQHKVTLKARDRVTLALSPISETRYLNAPSMPAPVLYEPNSNSIVSNLRPTIKGTTINNTIVYLYLDGSLIKKTYRLYADNGRPYVVYQVPNNLSVGWHSAYAYAESEYGERSLVSNTINFRVSQPMTTPTLRKIKFSNNRLEVNGVAANSSILSTYVDGTQINGKFKAGSSYTGVAGFDYTYSIKLAKGRHSVCVVAGDNQGKTSNCSNKLYFNVGAPSITKVAAIEKSADQIADEKKNDSDRDGLTNYDETNVYKTNPKKADTDGDGYNDKAEIENGYSPLIATKKDPKYLAKLEKIDSDNDGLSDYLEIYVYKTNSKKADTDGDGYNDKVEIDNGYNPLVSSIKDTKKIKAATIQNAKLDIKKEATQAENKAVAKNETAKTDEVSKTEETNKQTEASSTSSDTKNTKSNFKVNLIIFLVFLVGIIAWIIWVNRELIKERARQNKEEALRKEDEKTE